MSNCVHPATIHWVHTMSCAYLAHLYMHVLGKDIVLGVLTVPAYKIQNTHACLQVADDFQCTQYTHWVSRVPQYSLGSIGCHPVSSDWFPAQCPDLWQIRGDTGQQLTPGPATGKWLGQRQFKIYMVQGTATAR